MRTKLLPASLALATGLLACNQALTYLTILLRPFRAFTTDFTAYHYSLSIFIRSPYFLTKNGADINGAKDFLTYPFAV